VWDSATLLINDVEDQAALVERGYREWRWRTPRCCPLLARMLKALSERLPSFSVSLWTALGPKVGRGEFPWLV
jgi:hypothetical protein